MEENMPTYTTKWCNIDVDNKREIKKNVLEILTTLERAFNDARGQRLSLNGFEFSMKQIENQKMSTIAADKVNFPNDISRKAELSKQLETDANYQRLREQATELESELKDCETTITLCKQALYGFDIITR